MLAGLNTIVMLCLVVSSVVCLGAEQAVGKGDVNSADAEQLAVTSQKVNELLAQGNLKEAEPLLIKLLEIRRRVLGEENPQTLDSMRWLGVLYYNQGRYSEAEPLLIKAMEISRRALGEKHPDTLLSVRHLGELYCLQGRYSEAEPLLVKALMGMRSVLGEKHQHTIDALNYLTSALEHLGSQGIQQYKEGKFEEAVATLKRVDEDRRSVIKSGSRPCEIAYIAMALHRLGRDEEAKPNLDRLRDLLKDERFIKDENAKNCLAEAEQLINGVTQPATQKNLIINGGFEEPALAGDCDRYSDNLNGQGFLTGLTGWTFPTNNNSFLLEHGMPTGAARYHGGRQAVSLNYDGSSFPPLSQTFPTTAGQKYLLTFALGEENVSHKNSPTLLRVDVGSLSETVHLDDPVSGGNPSINGYTIYSATFTAYSSSTTLCFTDVTPSSAAFDSAFLDDVSVEPEPATASAQALSETNPAQNERLAKLKKCDPNNVSFALLPIEVRPKHPMATGRLVADVLGLVCESFGMNNIDALDMEFAPPADTAWEQVPAYLAEFLKKNPPKSEYVLYAQYLGTPNTGPTEVRFVVTDSTGNLLLTDRQTPQDEDFKRTAAADPDPMGCSALVAQRLFSRLGWKRGEAKPHGKFAQKWAQMSGLPGDSELAAMEQRLEKLKTGVKTTQIAIYATCIGDEHNAESASRLVSLATQRLGCKTTTVDKPVSIQHQPTGNEQKLLWDLAREFRDYLLANPTDSNYAMLAEYFIDPGGRQMAGAVHFVVCEKSGDWVLVDFQNNQHEDFQRISPKSIEDCDRLAVERLAKRLK